MARGSSSLPGRTGSPASVRGFSFSAHPKASTTRTWFAEHMHESRADLDALRELLDRSYAAAGAHLLRIHTPERRLNAEQVVERLTGMCLLALATVTSDWRPIVGPVDGIFFRGAFHFGSSRDSLRFRHIRARPQVSATHLPAEEFAVTVHGRAAEVDVRAAE